MKSDSQCARVLAVLADGRPHRMEEIHERVGFCRLNSRIAELRTPVKGSHEIVCDRSGGVYTYRLVGGPLAEPDSAATTLLPGISGESMPVKSPPSSSPGSASGRSLSEESVAIPVGAGHSGSPSDRNEEAAGFSLSDCGQLAWDVAA